MTKPKSRSRWRRWLPIVAVFIGIGLGLLVGWELWPVEYTNVAPDSLYSSHREEYIVLISQTYAYDGDIGMARSRLAALGDLDTVGPEVAALASRYVDQNSHVRYIQPLAELAFALGYERTALAAYVSGTTGVATWTPVPTITPTPLPTQTPSPIPPSPTTTATPTYTPPPTQTPSPTPTFTPDSITPVVSATPLATATPVPTRTPTATPTPAPRFKVVEKSRTCQVEGGQLMVMVLDDKGQQIPNVEILVRWAGQSDRFVTGLKPELGPGYADLALEKDEIYQAVIVGAESEVATDIVADTCLTEGYLASWQVVFQWNDQS